MSLTDEQLAQIRERHEALRPSFPMAGGPRMPEHVDIALRATEDVPALLAEVERLRAEPAAVDCGDAVHAGMTCDEYDEALEDAAEAAAERDDLRRQLADVKAERDRFREHSVTLNGVSWKLAAALGDIAADPLDMVDRMTAERGEAQCRLRDVLMAKVWTNEDGRRFVFSDDLLAAAGLITTQHADAGPADVADEPSRQCGSLLADPDDPNATLWQCVRDAGHDGTHWSRSRSHEWTDAEQYDPNADNSPEVA